MANTDITYRRCIVEFQFDARHLDDGYYAVPEGIEAGHVFERDEDDDEIVPDEFIYLADDEDEAKRILALMHHLDEFKGGEFEVTSSYDGTSVERIGCHESYIVGTDSECDELWDQDLENYIDDCILHQLPERYRSYFDNEKFKADAMIDGRAHSLANYDGHEYNETVSDGQFEETYYIYRTN